MYHQVIDCEVEAPLDFFLDEETHQWVVDCPCLKITTQAETKEKAHGAFAEALALWLASCINRNTLTGALQELGFVRGSLPYGQGESPQQIAGNLVLRNTAQSLGLSLKELKIQLSGGRRIRKRQRKPSSS